MSTDKLPMPITVQSEQGKRILDFLTAELSLPRLTRRFVLTVEMDGLLVVECEYLPEQKE